MSLKYLRDFSRRLDILGNAGEIIMQIKGHYTDDLDLEIYCQGHDSE